MHISLVTLSHVSILDILIIILFQPYYYGGSRLDSKLALSFILQYRARPSLNQRNNDKQKAASGNKPNVKFEQFFKQIELACSSDEVQLLQSYVSMLVRIPALMAQIRIHSVCVWGLLGTGTTVCSKAMLAQVWFFFSQKEVSTAVTFKVYMCISGINCFVF